MEYPFVINCVNAFISHLLKTPVYCVVTQCLIFQSLLVRFDLIFNENYLKSIQRYVSAENDQYKQLWQEAWDWFSMQHIATFTNPTASAAPLNLWKHCFTSHNKKKLYYFLCLVYHKPCLNVVPSAYVCVCLCLSFCPCVLVVCVLNCAYCANVCVWKCVYVIRGRNWIRDGSVATIRWKYLTGRATCPEKSHPTFHTATPACIHLLNGCLLWLLAAFKGMAWLYYINSHPFTGLL